MATPTRVAEFEAYPHVGKASPKFTEANPWSRLSPRPSFGRTQPTPIRTQPTSGKQCVGDMTAWNSTLASTTLKPVEIVVSSRKLVEDNRSLVGVALMLAVPNPNSEVPTWRQPACATRCMQAHRKTPNHSPARMEGMAGARNGIKPTGAAATRDPPDIVWSRPGVVPRATTPRAFNAHRTLSAGK